MKKKCVLLWKHLDMFPTAPSSSFQTKLAKMRNDSPHNIYLWINPWKWTWSKQKILSNRRIGKATCWKGLSYVYIPGFRCKMIYHSQNLYVHHETLHLNIWLVWDLTPIPKSHREENTYSPNLRINTHSISVRATISRWTGKWTLRLDHPHWWTNLLYTVPLKIGTLGRGLSKYEPRILAYFLLRP